jgi:hypothetical protein
VGALWVSVAAAASVNIYPCMESAWGWPWVLPSLWVSPLGWE